MLWCPLLTSYLKEGFSDGEFAEKFVNGLPAAFKWLSWYIGQRLHRNLQCDSKRTNRLLEAVGRSKEIPAVFEMYRYRYGWQGDRNKAVDLYWQAAAPRYFSLSGTVEKIEKDEEQEKLIGVAQGLQDYADKNPAAKAMIDGFCGRLGSVVNQRNGTHFEPNTLA